MFLLPLLLLFFSNLLKTQQNSKPGDVLLINVINQINNLTLLSNSNLSNSNRIYAENILPISSSSSSGSLLQASEDFIIPNIDYFKSIMNTTFSNGKKDCSSLQITLDTFRTKTNSDPFNITIQFIKNDNSSSSSNSPSNSNIIFTKTFSYPIGGWNDDSTLNSTNLVILNINNGDIDDNNQTIFDLTDSSFLSENETIWISFYVTLKLNPVCKLDTTTQSMVCTQNGMYWITYYSNTSSSLNPFYFRDINNLLRKNFQKWTNANTVLPTLSMDINLINLAFSISLNCTIPYPTEEPTVEPTLPPTEEPSEEPTEEPTLSPTKITNMPTDEGDDIGNEILTNVPTTQEPTEEPTSPLMPTNQPTTITTISPTIITSSNNDTLIFDDSNPMQLLQTLLISGLVPALFIFIVIILLLFYYKRRRDRISTFEYYNDKYDNDVKRRVDIINNNDTSIELKEMEKEEEEEQEDSKRHGLRGKSVKELFHSFKAKIDDGSKGSGTDYSSDDNEIISKKSKQQQQQQHKQTWRGNKNYEKIDLITNVKDEGTRKWLSQSMIVPLNSTDDDAFDKV